MKKLFVITLLLTLMLLSSVSANFVNDSRYEIGNNTAYTWNQDVNATQTTVFIDGSGTYFTYPFSAAFGYSNNADTTTGWNYIEGRTFTSINQDTTDFIEGTASVRFTDASNSNFGRHAINHNSFPETGTAQINASWYFMSNSNTTDGARWGFYDGTSSVLVDSPFYLDYDAGKIRCWTNSSFVDTTVFPTYGLRWYRVDLLFNVSAGNVGSHYSVLITDTVTNNKFDWCDYIDIRNGADTSVPQYFWTQVSGGSSTGSIWVDDMQFTVTGVGGGYQTDDNLFVSAGKSSTELITGFTPTYEFYIGGAEVNVSCNYNDPSPSYVTVTNNTPVNCPVNGYEIGYTVELSGGNSSLTPVFENLSVDTVTNNAPTLGPAYISPLNPVSTDNLTSFVNYTDPNSDEGNVTVAWYVNNVHTVNFTALNVPSGAQVFSTLTSAFHSVGDDVSVRVIANDGYGLTATPVWSDNVTIGNLKPTLSFLSLNPASPTVSDAINATVFFSDVESPVGNITFEWFTNGSSVLTASSFNVSNGSFTSSLLGAVYTQELDVVLVNVRAFDGFNYSDALNVSVVIPEVVEPVAPVDNLTGIAVFGFAIALFLFMGLYGARTRSILLVGGAVIVGLFLFTMVIRGEVGVLAGYETPMYLALLIFNAGFIGSIFGGDL